MMFVIYLVFIITYLPIPLQQGNIIYDVYIKRKNGGTENRPLLRDDNIDDNNTDKTMKGHVH